MVLFWSMIIGFCLAGTLADADETSDEAAEREKNLASALKLTREAAETYRFRIGDGDESAVVLRREPILQWSNPEQGEVHGNVFLWTTSGRPVVVGSLFKWYSPFTHVSHEFHSLTTSGLQARMKGTEVWKTGLSGLQFTPVPEAPEVAGSAVQRLVQMRQIARQFTARATQRDGVTNDLRLLPQPAYRYELEPSPAVLIDGGLFVFVQGTDPELWLLLEAERPEAGSAAHWNYALVRMNSIAIEVRRRDAIAAHFETIAQSDVYRHRQPYTSFLFKEE